MEMHHSRIFVLSSYILALSCLAVPSAANPDRSQQLVQEDTDPREQSALTALRTGSASDVNRKANALAAVRGSSNLLGFDSDANSSLESGSLLVLGAGLLLGAGMLRRALGISPAPKPSESWSAPPPTGYPPASKTRKNVTVTDSEVLHPMNGTVSAIPSEIREVGNVGTFR